MIETEQQRRWWFATHPEFSSSRGGQRSKHYGDEDGDPDRPSPEFVDAWVDRRLKHEKDDFFIEVLRDVKFWYGTEAVSKNSAEHQKMVERNEGSGRIEDESGGASGEDWWSQQPSDHPAADRSTYDKYEDVLDRIAGDIGNGNGPGDTGGFQSGLRLVFQEGNLTLYGAH